METKMATKKHTVKIRLPFFRNKQGGPSEIIIDFYAVLTLVVVFIIFFGLLIIAKKTAEVNIQNAELQQDADIILLSLLRTPYDGSSLADVFLSGDASQRDKAKTSAEDTLNTHFTAYYDEDCCWQLRFFTDPYRDQSMHTASVWLVINSKKGTLLNQEPICVLKGES